MLNAYLANRFATNLMMNKFAKDMFNRCLNVEFILNLYTTKDSESNNFLNST